MKKLITIIGFLVLLGISVTAYAQEEFFGNSSGFSFSYSNALNTHENSGGVSLYVKNKMIIGINFASIDNKVYCLSTIGKLAYNVIVGHWQTACCLLH